MEDHRATVVSRKEFLVNNELLSDVVFLVGEAKQRIYAHKVLLVAASVYFNTMFKEGTAGEIPLEDIEWPILEQILRHIYCGKINLTMDNVRVIFVHSKKYMLWELLDEISNFLVQNVTPENALEMHKLNRFFEFETFGEKSLEVIRDNPLHYFTVEDFVGIDVKSLQDIVESPYLNCTGRQLYKVLELWHEANPLQKVDELKSFITRRIDSYHCTNLRIYGEMKNAKPYQQLDVSYSAASDFNRISLYGIRVFVNCKGMLTVRINTNQGNLSTNEYKVDELERNGKADCFFPKVELLPDLTYKICLSGDGLSTSNSISKPSIQEKGWPSFVLLYGAIPAQTCITDFYCNITPFMSKKRRFEN